MTEPDATESTPSITIESDTLPAVAVSTAVPVPLTITTPSLVTVNTPLLLELHVSDKSVLTGVTSATTLTCVPTTAAKSSI